MQFQISDSKVGNQVYLGYYLGNKSYIKDSTTIDQNGKFHFSYSTPLDQGIYMIVFPEESNSYFEFLIDEDQQFEINTKQSELVNSASIKGSSVNTQFFSYMKKIESFKMMSEKADSIQKEAINKDYELYKTNFIAANSSNLVGKLLQFNERPNIPENLTDPTEQFYYYKSHFFDSKDFNFNGLIRSQFYHNLLTEYIEKLTYQTPDSLIKACDLMLSKTSSNKELFKYTLTTLLNKYALDKTVCFDKIYVHLVNQYYVKNKANWMNETEESRDQLNKIIESSKRLESCLCGNTAYDFKLNDKRDQNKQLSSINAAYTIILFWDHSGAKTSKIFDFFSQNTSLLKEKNAAFVSFPISVEIEKNLQFIEKNNFDGVINADIQDPNLILDTKKYYDIITTPTIYLLDKDKKIIYKRISAEQTIDFIKSL